MSGGRRARTTATGLLLGWGGLLLARPGSTARAVCGGGPIPPLIVVRVLGLRRVVQQILLLVAPSRPVALGAAGTDVLHALSMLAAVRIWPEYRRAALTSAGIAVASAALTVGTS